MRRWSSVNASLVAALAALALSLAACGSDSADDASSAPATTTGGTTSASSAPTVRSSTALGLTADPGGALTYVEQTLEAPAGSIEITLTNASSAPHNVSIRGQGTSRTVAEGDTAVLQIADLSTGSYRYFCTVRGHRQAGMEGTLIVE